MIKCESILSISLIFLPFLIWSQDFEEFNKSPRSSKAMVDLERMVLETHSITERADFIYQKATLLAQNDDFEGAKKEITRINAQSFDKLRAVDIYRIGFFHYLAEDYQSATFFFDMLEYFEAHDSLVPDYHLIAALNALWLEDYDKCRDLVLMKLNSINDLDSVTRDAMMTEIFSKKGFKKIKSASTARRLSYLPGAGQMYAGNILKGVTSILLIGAAIYYGSVSFHQGYYANGVISGFMNAIVFYSGGVRHAEFLTNKHNHRYRKRIASNLFVNYSSFAKNN